MSDVQAPRSVAKDILQKGHQLTTAGLTAALLYSSVKFCIASHQAGHWLIPDDTLLNGWIGLSLPIITPFYLFIVALSQRLNPTENQS